MERFAELPPELVTRILQLSATASDPLDPLERRRIRRQLGSLSLVHSTWTPIAQRLLLGPDPVRLYHRREYAPFVQLALARGASLAHLVNRIDLEWWGEEQDTELAAVLQACDGVEELVLTYVERVHLEQVATGPNLSALSLRQCTLVSSSFPLLEPPPSAPLPPPPHFTALTSFDLRLCSLRRDFLPFSLHSSHRPLPNLQHLLLHTGAHDQSPGTVRALVRSVAPQLRSLSLDATAEEIVFGHGGGDGAEPSAPRFPALRALGLYWDAAYSRLVGTRFLLPPLPPASSARAASAPPPPFLHLSLYPAPSTLPAIGATLLSLLESAELRAGMRWRRVEHLRAEGTLRDLDGFAGDEADEEDEGEGARAGEARPGERPTDALLRAARDAGVDLLIEDAPSSHAAGEEGEQPQPQSQRATFARGFDTSWWRFVREVERDDVRRAADSSS